MAFDRRLARALECTGHPLQAQGERRSRQKNNIAGRPRTAVPVFETMARKALLVLVIVRCFAMCRPEEQEASGEGLSSDQMAEGSPASCRAAFAASMLSERIFSWHLLNFRIT